MKLARAQSSFANYESNTTVTPSLDRKVEDLLRENARLRRTVAELETYRALAYRDALTGLWNRRYFEERLGQEVSLARRNPTGRFSLLALDLNDLKRINDQEGHAAGDVAIQAAADFLRSRLREHDVCCRTGGDEFIVILRDLGPAEAAQCLTRLRGELATANAGRATSLSLSMGVASYPEDSTSPRELSLRADEAMYADKRQQKSSALGGAGEMRAV